MGLHIQCVLNFNDNHIEDGGTILVPKFHHLLADWATDNMKMKKPLPWIQFPFKG